MVLLFVKLRAEVDYIKSEFYFRIVKVYITEDGALDWAENQCVACVLQSTKNVVLK